MDFKTAISEANKLLVACDGRSEAMSASCLLPFFADEEGARGFFVAWLTDDWKFPEGIPESLLAALKQKPSPAYSVLVRNLAMSSATEASHKRSGDVQKAYMSAVVAERSINLIERLNDETLWTLLSEMRRTLIGESGVFSDFLSRMKYSDDEKMAALSAIEQALATAPQKSQDSLDLLNPFDQ